MQNRSVVVGLLRITPDSHRHLEGVFKMACGVATESPEFGLPWSGC